MIPVLIDGMEMMSPDELPDDLRALTRRNAVSLNTDLVSHRYSEADHGGRENPRQTRDPPAVQSSEKCRFSERLFRHPPHDPQDMGEVGRRVGELLKAQGIPLEPPTLKYLVEVVEELNANRCSHRGHRCCGKSYSPKLKLGATLLGLRAVSVKAAGKVSAPFKPSTAPRYPMS
ncbi:MAG: hypothetical protein U0670_10995 [Anaerolineae bacterium]